MAENKFPEGIRFFKPFQNAPKFVKGAISIDKDICIEWLSKQDTDSNGRIKLDLKESKDGKLYLSLNEYVNQPQSSTDL